ncbi:hypothetical protein QYE76_029051 [Lolium multiflorum]|uniref:Integrase catalytic domain-containing protein n=1 Tax=Lolium multiflorum TaxID=4521 RepID=A0AAD8QM35_LOLMU|nr:hypothetical protein QYE76_029051 [Lolium multiflorum]
MRLHRVGLHTLEAALRRLQDAHRLGSRSRHHLSKGDRLDYVLQIHFAASNNVAEYEALIHGLKMAKEIGVRCILCFGDSDLVVQQASGDCAKDANIASYRFHIQQLSGFFEGPFRTARGGMTHLLVMVDKFTKWIEVKPIKKLDGSTAVTFLKEIIVRYGYPHSIITDNGTNFAQGIFSRFCEEKGIRMDLSSVAHPESNGQVEKANGLILAGIRPRLVEPLR